MNKKYILPGLFAALMMASCADEFNPDFQVQRPVDLAKLAELEDYQPLKEYIDRSAHPTFKLGGALDAAEFTKKGVVYNVGVNNFDEVVAGNAMKYASCVDSKGNMDFSTVNDFVTAADQAGISVYGHTLAWHAQQQPKYLSSLIADKPKPVDPNAGGGSTTIVPEAVATVTYQDGPFPFYPMGSEPPVINGAIHFEPTGDWSQFFISNAIDLKEPGNYGAILRIKSSEEGTIKLTAQNGWSNQQVIDGNVKLSTDWTDVEVKFDGVTCEPSSNYDFILKPETFMGVIDLESLTIVRYKEVAGPTTVTEDKEIAEITYNDGPFPFYPMGCEPPVIDGALHFEPTGDWSQFFITNAINLGEPGDFSAILTIKSSEEGTIKLTAQNGWSNQQMLDGNVKLSTDWTDVEVKFDGITCEPSSNYDFILKPETFMGVIDLKKLKIVQHITKTVGGDGPQYVDKWTNELINSELDPSKSTESFIVRDANNNDAPATVQVGIGPDGKNAIIVNGKTNPAEEWDTQFFVYTPNKKWEAGEKYRFSMWYKATKAIGTDTQVHGTPGGYIYWQMLSPNPSFTTEWQYKEWEGSIPADGGGNQQTIAFNLNKNKSDDPGTQIDYYFSDIQWQSYSQVEVPKTEEQFIKKRVLIVETDDLVDYAWDSQFWIQTNEPFHAGDSFEFKAEVRATKAAAPGTQIHKGSAGGYIHWAAIGNTSFTEEWETVTATGTIPSEGDGGDFIAWNLNDFADANTYMFGSISFKINGVEMLNNTDLQSDDISSFWKKEKRGATINAPISDGYTITTEIKNTIPLTAEEKHDTLVWAMDKWIAGMMEACEGKVKAWDVVNEAISGGGDDGEGNYPLQHGTEDNTNDFFWQDHMGDLEYVRQAVRLARKYYAKSLEEAGGDDGKLKLFINDYNLESDWDQNKKVKSLINWIKKWEEDGVTKIDGIGSQMHISYYEDANILESKKKAIQESFKLMAATGKLVRISELDMGYVKADGTDATLDDMDNAEQVAAGYPREKAMEEYYKWIIEQYFTIIPEAQQYGITQWCLTDAPSGAGWRPDTPVGIWDTNWNRKYIYRGWTEALAK